MINFKNNHQLDGGLVSTDGLAAIFYCVVGFI